MTIDISPKYLNDSSQGHKIEEANYFGFLFYTHTFSHTYLTSLKVSEHLPLPTGRVSTQIITDKINLSATWYLQGEEHINQY